MEISSLTFNCNSLSTASFVFSVAEVRPSSSRSSRCPLDSRRRWGGVWHSHAHAGEPHDAGGPLSPPSAALHHHHRTPLPHTIHSCAYLTNLTALPRPEAFCPHFQQQQHHHPRHCCHNTGTAPLHHLHIPLLHHLHLFHLHFVWQLKGKC